jgi:hypothetical protein
MHTDFGASMLVKRRTDLRPLLDSQWPTRRQVTIEPSSRRADTDVLAGQLTFDDDVLMNTEPAKPRAERAEYRARFEETRLRAAPREREHVDIDQMMNWVARRGFSEEVIGYAIRRISERGTTEQLVAFTATLRSHLRNKPEA